MLCPYCSGEMIEGVILGHSYAWKWQAKSDCMILGIWASPHAIPLGETGLWSRPQTVAFRCSDCEKLTIIIDLKTEPEKGKLCAGHTV
jgi:hypothetical protein